MIKNVTLTPVEARSVTSSGAKIPFDVRSILDGDVRRYGGLWKAEGYEARIENWNLLAEENATHAAAAARNEAAEERKTAPNIEFLARHLEPGMRVLDVGCGYGRMAKFLMSRMAFAAYVGVDSSSVMLAKFGARYVASPAEGRTPILLINADIDRLPVRDAAIDACIVSAVFLHNHKDVTKAAVAEIRRVLRPGGKLLVIDSFPNAVSLTGLQGLAYLSYLKTIGEERKNGPVRYFSRGEVLDLLRDFSRVTVLKNGFSLYPKTILGMPKSLRWHFRRGHDLLHGFLRRHLPKRLQAAFCTHFDVVART